MERDIEKCVRLIRKGYSKDKIREKMRSVENFEEVYEIAKCRIKAKGKFSKKNLYFDEYGLRYSTPEIIGKYRAERIKNMRIADISCGVGMQAIFYSFTNLEVLGVDKEERRIKYARKNAEAYGAKNVRFVVGDCFSDEIYKIAKDYDVIFSDPARDETEEERKLSTLLPSPLRVMEKYGNRDYVFDLPPQISLDKIPVDWEKEFISINGRITRFTAYTGELKKYDRVAVSLPSGSVFYSNSPEESNKIGIDTKSVLLGDFIYIIDESLYYAHLLGEFAKKHELKYLQVGKRRTLASGDFLKNDFLKGFKIICKGRDIGEVIRCMKVENIGKTTLRFSISPDEYWKIRKKIEEKLMGEKKGSIFRIGDLWIGAENVT